MDTTQIETEIKDLHAQRQRLAPEAVAGITSAIKALEKVDDKDRFLSHSLDLSKLAQVEEAARAERAQEEAEQARRQELEARLARLHQERLVVAVEVDEAVDALLDTIERLMAIGREMYGVSSGLGHARRKLLLDDQVNSFLSWRLSGVMEVGPRPAHALRRPLADTLRTESPAE